MHVQYYWRYAFYLHTLFKTFYIGYVNQITGVIRIYDLKKILFVGMPYRFKKIDKVIDFVFLLLLHILIELRTYYNLHIKVNRF